MKRPIRLQNKLRYPTGWLAPHTVRKHSRAQYCRSIFKRHTSSWNSQSLAFYKQTNWLLVSIGSLISIDNAQQISNLSYHNILDTHFQPLGKVLHTRHHVESTICAIRLRWNLVHKTKGISHLHCLQKMWVHIHTSTTLSSSSSAGLESLQALIGSAINGASNLQALKQSISLSTIFEHPINQTS